jgi:hypothetical protein
MTIDLSERKASIKRQFRGRLNLDEMSFVLGDTDGTINNPNFPGKVWVQAYAAGGLLGHRSVYGPTRQLPMVPGMPIKLKYDRKGRLQIDEIDQDAQLATGITPAAVIQAQNSGSTTQTDQETLRCVAQSLPSMTVGVKAWNPIVRGVASRFRGKTQDMTSYKPSAGQMLLAVVAVKSDYSTLEITTSTARGISSLPLSISDAQEAIAKLTSGSTPVWAIRLTGSTATIAQQDIDNDGFDLRQAINTADTVQATTSTSGTVANTTAETSVLGSVVGSSVLAANALAVGRTLRIQAWGIVSDTGTPTLTVKVKLGSTVILTTGAITLASGISDKLWRLEAIITCRSVGGSGTVFGQGQFNYNNGLFTDIVNTATTTVDTTSSQTIDVTATWSAASSSNTISCTNAVLEVL